MSSFFKVLIKDYAFKLRIPAVFVSRFSSVVPKAVTLIRPSSNRTWTVDIVEEDDKRLYFKWGWNKFVRDNALKTGEFLVFKFDGDSTFKVKVFGTSSCEKEIQSQPCVNQNYCIQQYQNQTTPLNVEIKNERADSHDDNDHGNFNQEMCASQEEIEEQSDEIIDIQPESHDLDAKIGEGMYKRPKLIAVNEGSKSDSNPSFKIHLQQAYAEKGCMCIPTDFFKKYLIDKKQEVEIETEKGVWTVTLLPHMKRTCKFARFSKGWSEFARGNHFKAGETLTFKMVGRSDCPKFIVHRQ